jgi:3-hydroxybutyryl-CoA dehydratase
MINNFHINQSFSYCFDINQDVYDLFIKLSNDCNHMHVSDDYAQQHGFEGKIMHGNILNAFISYFIGECLPVKNIVIQSQSIDFKKPVYMNTKIQLLATVDSIVESVNVVIFKFNFQNNQNVVVAKGKIQIGLL